MELIALGRIIQDPQLIERYSESDFSDCDIRKLIRTLKSDVSRDYKDESIEKFMTSIGCSHWRAEKKDRLRVIEESHKRMAKDWAFREAVRKAATEVSIEKAEAIVRQVLGE